MKKIILIAFILMNINSLAQNNTDSLSLKLHYCITDYWKFMSREHGGGIYIGYDMINFPNNNLVKDKWGFNSGLRLALFPFMLDGYFSGHYLKINVPLYQSKYQTLRTSTIETSLSVFPVYLPYRWKLSKLSEYLVPYGGMGFQTMGIYRNKGVFEYETDKSYLRINSFLWKVGCNIYIPKFPVTINFEYKRTLNKNSLKKVEQIGIGIGFEDTPLTSGRSKRTTPKAFF